MANRKETKRAQVSRQTLWQRRHREIGLCVVCSEPAFKGWRCVKHYEQHKINMRFRYIPRVRGRYNVGGAVASTSSKVAKPVPKPGQVAARSTAAARSRRSSTSQKRSVKAQGS